MNVYKIDPLRDPRWTALVKRHPDASAFHTPGWLEALHRAYGYSPVVFTSSPPGTELTNGVVFCHISSWMTGRRLVSLPFSDHCEPLADSPDELDSLLGSLESDSKRECWKYIEIRPINARIGEQTGFVPRQIFCLHKLDLRPPLSELFRRFHKDSVQRKVRRAEREGLAYEEGRSESLLHGFFHLFLQTRRRHKLPPQPVDWFRNLLDCLGDQCKIRVASKDGRAIAGMLTLSYKQSMVYKYGCSDERFHNLGAMAFLFWKAIQDAKREGFLEFDMGRTDLDNPGLITFKEHWSTTRSTLTYWRCPGGASSIADTDRKMRIAKSLFARLPDGLLAASGRLLYRHIG